MLVLARDVNERCVIMKGRKHMDFNIQNKFFWCYFRNIYKEFCDILSLDPFQNLHTEEEEKKNLTSLI